jgi:hypothetical protein
LFSHKYLSTASTIRFRRSNEYAIASLKAISSTHSTANRCKKKTGAVSARENCHQSGGLLNLPGMTEPFDSDFSG